MPINFIPNDPAAGPAGARSEGATSSAGQAGIQSGFAFTGASPEGHIRSGNAAVPVLAVPGGGAGRARDLGGFCRAHTKWQGNRKKLPLRQDDGEDLNAFYDRASFSFFQGP